VSPAVGRIKRLTSAPVNVRCSRPHGCGYAPRSSRPTLTAKTAGRRRRRCSTSTHDRWGGHCYRPCPVYAHSVPRATHGGRSESVASATGRPRHPMHASTPIGHASRDAVPGGSSHGGGSPGGESGAGCPDGRHQDPARSGNEFTLPSGIDSARSYSRCGSRHAREGVGSRTCEKALSEAFPPQLQLHTWRDCARRDRLAVMP